MSCNLAKSAVHAIVSAMIFEWAPFHDEILPTSVALANALGATQVDIVKLDTGREFDIFDLMNQWGLNFTTSRTTVLQKKYDLYFINTLLLSPLLNEFAQRVGQAHKDAHFILGCHNALPCYEGLVWFREHLPNARLTTMAFSPAMHIATKKIPWLTGTILSIPFVLGPTSQAFDSSADTTPTILVPGSLDFSRRDYTLLARACNTSFKFLLFGKHTSTEEDAISTMCPHSITTASGTYKRLIYYARSSAFVAPLASQKTIQYNEYTLNGKMPSSIAIALALNRPLILSDQLAKAFNLEYHVTHDSLGHTFHASATRAEEIWKNPREYRALQRHMCVSKQSMWNQTLKELSTAVSRRPPPQSVSKPKMPPKDKERVAHMRLRKEVGGMQFGSPGKATGNRAFMLHDRLSRSVY